MNVLYGLTKLLSLIIRQFLLPNPFAQFKNGEAFNWIASFILMPVTFGMVSFLYERGSFPAWGSFLYLFFYFLNTTILLFCSIFKFNTLAIVIIGFLYIVFFGVLVLFRNKFGRGY